MLSDDINSLLNYALKYRDTGVTLAPHAVDSVVVVLLGLLNEARQIEKAIISPMGMAPEAIPDNVVPIRRLWPDGQGGVA